MAINNELNARLQHAIDEQDYGGNIYPSNDSIPLRGEVIFHLEDTDTFNTFKLGLGDTKYQDLKPYLLVDGDGDASTFVKGDGSNSNITNVDIPNNLTNKTYNNINLINSSTGNPQPTKSITITGNVTEETWVLVLSNNTTINRKMLISQ